MKNELLELFREHRKQCPPDTPGMGGMRFDFSVADHYLRGAACRQYAWAIPTDEALAKVAAFSPLVEIGAGSGYWAALLAARGADVVAYDQNPPQALWPADSHEEGKAITNHWGHDRCYFPVQFGGPESIRLHPERTLFVCWPPYDNPEGEFMASCLRHYKDDTILYVGESDGCTSWAPGMDEGWEEVESVDLPQWYGIHDYLMVLRRKR